LLITLGNGRLSIVVNNYIPVLVHTTAGAAISEYVRC